jgi:hypothetical protein
MAAPQSGIGAGKASNRHIVAAARIASVSGDL